MCQAPCWMLGYITMSSKIGYRAVYGAETSAIVKPVYEDSSCVCAVCVCVGGHCALWEHD